jgi:hypothetical protein
MAEIGYTSCHIIILFYLVIMLRRNGLIFFTFSCRLVLHPVPGHTIRFRVVLKAPGETHYTVFCSRVDGEFFFFGSTPENVLLMR